MYDLVIIGGGPAGVAAGMCAVACGSLKPSGFSVSATGKLPFPRPLSRGVKIIF